MTKRSKPFGVIATIVYAIIGGLIALPGGLLMLLASSVPGTEALMFTVAGILFSTLGVLYWAAVYGLKSLLEWGRQLMLWLSIISIPLGVISIFPIWPGQEMTAGNTVLQVFGIGISALIIHYLLRPSTRELFL